MASELAKTLAHEVSQRVNNGQQWGRVYEFIDRELDPYLRVIQAVRMSEELTPAMSLALKLLDEPNYLQAETKEKETK